jgi:hypothetical protein
MQDRPLKSDGLQIDEVEDGFVVYQADRARVHYLNPTARLILELCDGTLTAPQIAGLISQTYRLPDEPRREVDDALAALQTEGLVS